MFLLCTKIYGSILQGYLLMATVYSKFDMRCRMIEKVKILLTNFIKCSGRNLLQKSFNQVVVVTRLLAFFWKGLTFSNKLSSRRFRSNFIQVIQFNA